MKEGEINIKIEFFFHTILQCQIQVHHTQQIHFHEDTDDPIEWGYPISVKLEILERASVLVVVPKNMTVNTASLST